MAERWQDYINLLPSLDEHQSEVVRALNDIWATPEGRDLIRTAYENSPSRAPMDIRTGPQNAGFPAMNAIELNFDHIARIEYRDGSGWRGTSVVETLTHELFHMTDTHLNENLVRGPMLGSLHAAVRSMVTAPRSLSEQQMQRLSTALLSGAVGALYQQDPPLDMERLGNLRSHLEEFIFNPATLQEHAPHMQAVAAYVNRLVQSPERMRELAEETGIPGLTMRTTSASEISQHVSGVLQGIRRNRVSAEELATDYTDYFMLKYFGVSPRESYLDARLSPEGTDNSTTPSRRFFPEMDIRLANQEADVAEEAREYTRAALGRMDVPQLPNITAQSRQRGE